MTFRRAVSTLIRYNYHAIRGSFHAIRAANRRWLSVYRGGRRARVR